jgi:hypothetical protein
VLLALFILLNDLGQETISPQELLSCCLFFLLPSCRNLPLPLPLLLPVLLFVILVGICFRRFLFFPSKKTRHSDRSFSQSHREQGSGETLCHSSLSNHPKPVKL